MPLAGQSCPQLEGRIKAYPAAQQMQRPGQPMHSNNCWAATTPAAVHSSRCTATTRHLRQHDVHEEYPAAHTTHVRTTTALHPSKRTAQLPSASATIHSLPLPAEWCAAPTNASTVAALTMPPESSQAVPSHNLSKCIWSNLCLHCLTLTLTLT